MRDGMRDRMSIRGRRDQDMEACVRALAAVHRADWYPARWPDDPRQWLTPSHMLQAWVAVEGAVVHGHVALTAVDGEVAEVAGLPAEALAAVSRLFVGVDARRDGLARRLLSHAARAAVASGLRPVLEVESGATAAVALYERAGWRFAGAFTADWTAPDGQLAVMRVYVGATDGQSALLEV